jgi:hypothetical protein
MPGLVKSGWTGFRRNVTLWTGLFLGKLVLALLVVLPVMALVNTSVDSSVFAAPLLHVWSLDVIIEIVLTRPNLMPVFLLTLAFFALLVFLLKQFLNGGIYGSLMRGATLDARSFFAEAGALFGGNLKISLFMLPVYIILAIVALIIVPVFPRDGFGHYQTGAMVGLAGRAALLYIIFIVGGIFSDLMRLHLTVHPQARFATNLRAMIDLYRRRFVKLNGLYYLYFIPFVLVWLLIERLALLATGGLNNVIGVMAEMLLFQICSWLRTGQSLLFASTAAGIVRSQETVADVTSTSPPESGG